MIKRIFITCIVVMFLSHSTAFAKKDEVCYSREENAFIRKKTAERKATIKILNHKLEGCERSKVEALKNEILKRKALEKELSRANPTLPWILLGVVSAAAIVSITILVVVR